MLHTVAPVTVAAAVRGASEVEQQDDRILIRRLPDWTKAQYPDVTIETGASWLSGVRLELDTAASEIELKLHFHRLHLETAGFPLRPAVVTIEADGELQHFSHNAGDVLHVDEAWTATYVPGQTTTITAQLAPTQDERRVIIWLPHNCSADIVSVTADSAVQAATSEAPRWVHYGSSISNASEADDPTGVWPVIVARQLGLDLFNVALPGNAQLDGFAARTIRDTPASVITVKIGINIVNAASMLQRAFVPAVHAFLDTIREGHPGTPIAVISPIFCPPHETSPGPTVFVDGRADSVRSATDQAGALTVEAIRELLRQIVDTRSQVDPLLTYIDGLALLGPTDAAHLPDDLHPDAEGYRLIARRFTPQLTQILAGAARDN